MTRRSQPGGLRGPSQRQLRAGELLRHALAGILSREALRDPDLAEVHITVGEVRCSPDLKHATVFVSPLGDTTPEGRARLAAALGRASAFLRSRLAREIEMKHTPMLHFVGDASYDEGAAIDRLLADPRVRRDIDGEGG